MKRDIELIRKILLDTESQDKLPMWHIPEFPNFTDIQIAYHIKLLGEAGLLEIKDMSSKDHVKFVIKNLTWEGHEFLDASRDNKIWKLVKTKLGPKINSVTLEIIKSLLLKQIEASLSSN